MQARFDAIVFDLWGTLVPNLPASRMTVMLEEVVRVLGAPQEEFTSQWKGDGWRLRAIGVYESGAECAQGIAQQLGVTCDPQDLESIAHTYREFITSHLVPSPGVVDSLTRWKEAGLALGLASDCTRETEAAWPGIALSGLIEKPVFSSELGIKKPDSRIFLAACEKLGADPKRCLYLADGAGGELEAAAGIGMQVVQILWPDEDEATALHLRRASWAGDRICAIEELDAFL